MSLFSNKSFGAVLIGTVLFSVAAVQGCSSDDQAAPAAGGGGAGGKANGGGGGKPATAGAGNSTSEGGDVGTAGDEGVVGGSGGEAGAVPVDCDQSFPNSTLTAISDNGGVLPDLP